MSSRHVFLVCLADTVTYGGFITYTTHLARAFQTIGAAPHIVRIRTQTSQKEYADGYPVYNMPLTKLLHYAKQGHRIHIVYAYWKKQEHVLQELLKVGASITLHDPTEYSLELLECIEQYGAKIVSIRKTNEELLQKKYGLQSKFILHPYRCHCDLQHIDNGIRTTGACSTSRIDFDKHTELIIRANMRLLQKKVKPISIYGAINRLYDFHKLRAVLPDWREQFYQGTFPKITGAVFNILRKYQVNVDMSAIKQDGGGTQYTFLEAIDAGCLLILNSAWITGIKGATFIDRKNCLTAGTAEELVSSLQWIRVHPKEVKNMILTSRKILQNHAPKQIAIQYSKYLFEKGK